MPDNGPSSFPSLPQIETSTAGVIKLLDNLKPHKASGPDSIPPMVLKELSNEIAPILQIIFQIYLTTGQVTDDWKKANVAPILKKGDEHKRSNYRPVSLTCITSIIIVEHIIVSNLMKHLEIQNILFPLQHGFRRNHSCESQLLSFFQDLASSQTCLLWTLAKLLTRFSTNVLITNSTGMASEGIHLSGSQTFSVLDPRG